MYKNYSRDSVDPENPFLVSSYGTFLLTVQVGDASRRVLMYIPEDIRECSSAVCVFPPDGWSCERAYENSNWKQIANDDEHKEKLAVLFLEPQNGASWQSDLEGDCPGEVAAYMDAILNKLEGWNPIHIDMTRIYLVGYGEGGTAAQMAAMDLPARLAGVVSVGGNPISPEYMEQASKAPCKKLCGYTDIAWEKGYINGEIPLPAWIIDDPEYCRENSRNMVEYWRHVCGANAKAVKIAPDTDAYCRTTSPPHPLNQDRAAHRVWHSVIPDAVSSMGERLNRRIWKTFLFRSRRWGGDLEGDLRVHIDPVEDVGFIYHYQLIGGWMREWYTYVPRSVKENPAKKVPLVFALHGYGSSGEFYCGCAQWFKVAESRGFILICPSATNGGDYLLPSGERCRNVPAWNMSADPLRANEYEFFRAMIEITASEYKVDHTRIYSTGHSMGATTTHILGLAMPTVFAAIAPCSGVIPGGFYRMLNQPEITNRPNVELPVWMFVGRDESDLLPAVPKDGNDTAESIVLWRRRNDFKPEKPENWTEGWVDTDRYREIIYYKNNIPIIRYSQVSDMPHAVLPEMSFRIWDEFFSKFSRGDDGSIVYQNS